MFSSPPLEDGRNLRSDWLRDTMSTSCRSLKSNKIPNQILVWAKGSLRSLCSKPKRLQCTTTSHHRYTLLGLYPVYWYTKLTSSQVNKLTQIRSYFWTRPYRGSCSRSPQFTTCEPTVARVHHMRTHRSTGRKRTNAQPNTRTRLPSRKPEVLKCKWHKRVASGANCIADENVKPHMRIPSSPLSMRKSPVSTGTMPRSRQWIAPFADLPGVLTPEISGEGAKQVDKREFPQNQRGRTAR